MRNILYFVLYMLSVYLTALTPDFHYSLLSMYKQTGAGGEEFCGPYCGARNLSDTTIARTQSSP